MRRLPPILVLAAAIAAFLLTRGAGEGDDGLAIGRVVRVVDGDTIRVRLGGRVERVRYIGVDTPESVKSGSPVECFAKAASAANERLVAGQRVRLVSDVERRDRYGRVLAYVYLVRDGRFVNAELVEGGYARPLTVAPNVRFAGRFVALARGARHAGRGLWRACP